MDHVGVRDSPVRHPASSAVGSIRDRLVFAVRLDDVQLALAAAAALKAIERWASGQFLVSTALVVSIVLMWWRPQLGAAGIAVAMLSAIDANHAMFLFLVAVVVAGFPGAQRRFLLRTQLTALYLFAGVAKATSDHWLAGGVLGERGPLLAFGVLPVGLVVWGTVVAEVGLAGLIWIRPTAARWVGLGMHAAITFGMWTAVPDKVVSLLLFNLLAAAVLWAVTRPATSPSGSPPRPPLRWV